MVSFVLYHDSHSIGDPESFVDVLPMIILLLWVGALFFALRGNNANDIWILLIMVIILPTGDIDSRAVDWFEDPMNV